MNKIEYFNNEYSYIKDNKKREDLKLLVNELPDYYITKEEAARRGWKSWRGNLAEVAPNQMIFGGIYKNKDGIPTMGGIIFIIPTILTVIILLLFHKIEYSSNLFIILFVFIGYALLGFIDDFLIIRRGKNEGLTEIQKLFGQLVIAIIF